MSGTANERIATAPLIALAWLGAVLVGSVVGMFTPWSLDTWRLGLSADTNARIGVVVFGLATLAPIIWLAQARRRFHG
jgi:hypothetical protein